MSQLTLDFTPGLTQRFRSLADVIEEMVKAHPHPAKTLAMDLNYQPGYFNRMVSATDDGAWFPAARMDELMDLTKSKLYLHWLAEKCHGDPEADKQRFLEQLQTSVDQQAELIAIGRALIDAEKVRAK